MTTHGKTSSDRQGRGFTLVELVIGLAILVLIGGAIAGLAHATSSAWAASESSQSLSMSVRQSVGQLERLIRTSHAAPLATSANQFVLVPGWPMNVWGQRGADLMLWQGDTDSVMKLGEVVLIRHDVTNKCLKLYQVNPGTSAALQSCDTADINTSFEADSFTRLSVVSGHTLASNVTDASFRLIKQSTAWQNPAVEIVLTYKCGDLTRTEYRTVTLRAPSAQ